MKKNKKCTARVLCSGMVSDFHRCGLKRGHKGKHKCKRENDTSSKYKYCKFAWSTNRTK